MRAGAAVDQLGPLVGDPLELAVAVELVAEQVAEHDQRRGSCSATRGSHASSTSNSPSLALLLEQRRGDAPAHVRAGAVVDRLAAGRVQGGGEHPGGRRLAVGGADDRSSPSSSRPPSRAIASGAMRSSRRPGSVVPPPRPLRRLSAAGRAGERRPSRAKPGRARLRAVIGRAISSSARAGCATVVGRSVRWSPSA